MLDKDSVSLNVPSISTMLLRCAVSDAVSFLPLSHLFKARVLLINTMSNQRAREASVLSSLLRRGRSPEWLRHHCLNSLQRSKWSLVSGIFGRWVAMMLLRCAVSDAVSFLPLGLLLRARARLAFLLSS